MRDDWAREKMAFEQTIRENPYAYHYHGMYADWLEERGFDDEAVLQRSWTAEKQRAAEAFFDRYAEECSCDANDWREEYLITREELIQVAHDFLDGRDAWITLPFDTPDIVYGSRREFWEHFMVLTGRPVPEDRRDEHFISCAC